MLIEHIKHQVVGLMRSIAPHFYKQGPLCRVNAICPGTVRTNLLDSTAWSTFTENQFVPIEKIASTVLMLIDGYDKGGRSIEDGELLSDGINQGEKLNGKAVELSGSNHYYRDQHDYSDADMERTMKATDRVAYNE